MLNGVVLNLMFSSLFTAAAKSIQLKCLTDDNDDEGEGTGNSVRELSSDFDTSLYG